MAELQWTQEELQGLSEMGLSITPHSDRSYGWGYTWRTRDWVGPFTTPGVAIHAAFTDALLALQFRSDVLFALEALENRVGELIESVALLRETTDTAIGHLAAHVSHLALQLKVDQAESED